VEMVRVHQEVTERIRIVRRLDFTYQNRIDVTYAEHGYILQALLERRQDEALRLLRAHIQSSQTEVRHITLHQVQQARAASRAE
jgi:DNA-binding GntR family transcriptional regulator